MKKIIALMLALIMVLSLSVAVYATPEAETAETTAAAETVETTEAVEEAEVEAEAETEEETADSSKGLAVIHTVLTVVQVIAAVVLIIVVTAQSGKNSGLGAISGNSDTFMAKNPAASFDAKLTKATKWIAIAFIVLTLIINLLLVASI